MNLVVVGVVMGSGGLVDVREGRFPGGGRSQRAMQMPPTSFQASSGGAKMGQG